MTAASKRAKAEGAAIVAALHPLEPGVHPDITSKRHRDDPAVAPSDVFRFADPSNPPKGRKLLQGDALHGDILEPEVAAETFITAPADWKLNDKVEKRLMKEFEAENPGKVVLRPKERAEVNAWYTAMMADDQVRQIIEAEGENEVTIVAELPLSDKQDAPTVLCKGRLDLLRRVLIADVKTTSAAGRHEFADHVVEFRYNATAAFYVDLVKAALGIELPFLWLPVSKYTHVAWVHPCPPDLLAAGRRHYRDVLSIYARARAAGVTL